jgi:lipopolysaccharide/colanic/teichoic acid biosynthesis glycosyltransferase
MTGSTDLRRYIESDISVTFRHDRGYERRQRAFDLFVGLSSLMLAAPVLGAAALAIWLDDRGSPLFTQQRVGQFGRLFRIYKLRTMRLAACTDALSPSTNDDARVTRIGTFLRKTSIDELPQLLNVIKGDMAIVGPRPEMPFVVGRYERWQHCRHLRKPGITGLWQISVRKQIPLHHPDATKIDLEYVRTASTMTDGSIFLRTFPALFKAQGAF